MGMDLLLSALSLYLWQGDKRAFYYCLGDIGKFMRVTKVFVQRESKKFSVN